MTKNRGNYVEHILLGINKAMVAFLISFILCLVVSLVINLYFYKELVTVTVGSLGEGANPDTTTILRTLGLILGLSTFQAIGKFQMGLLILALIPLLSFFVAGLMFRLDKIGRESQLGLGILMVDGLAALVYAGLVSLTGLILKGLVFGINVDLLSLGNFGFVVVFALFIQVFLGMDRDNAPSVISAGLAYTRKLLRLILGFSGLIGILFVVYYLISYLKGIGKIIGLIILVLPNLAVYLSFLFMGISIDFTKSFGSLVDRLPFSLDILSIPLGIQIALIVTFIILVFIILLRIPTKRYWLNLLVFVVGFSLSTAILAMASRINSGIDGALKLNIEISLWKAFLVPFVIISLDGALLGLLRVLCVEMKGDQPKGFLGALLCGLDPDQDSSPSRSARQDLFSQEIDLEAEKAEPEEEIDIWKELAARKIPNINERKGEKKPSLLDKADLSDQEKGPDWLDQTLISPGFLQARRENAIKNYDRQAEKTEVDGDRPLTQGIIGPVEPGKEVDISLFPRKKTPHLEGDKDLVDMDQDPSDGPGVKDESRPKGIGPESNEEEEFEETQVIEKIKQKIENLEETMPYALQRRDEDR